MPIWHIITGEYPPQPGGVSDYTTTVAHALSEAGDEVHVWCPASVGSEQDNRGPRIHRDCGTFAWRDLRRLTKLLNAFTRPRRLLVQWVPHAFGCRALNVAF